MEQTDLNQLPGSLQTKIVRRVVGILVVPAFLLILVFYIAWQAVQESMVAGGIAQRTARIALQVGEELDAWALNLRELAADEGIRAYMAGQSAQLATASFERLYAKNRGRRLGGVLSGLAGTAEGPAFSTWRVPEEYRRTDRMPGWGVFDLLDRHPGQVMAYRESLAFGTNQASVLTLGILLDPGAAGARGYLMVNLSDQGFQALFMDNGNGVSTKYFLTTAADRVVAAQDRSWVNEFGEFRVDDSEGRLMRGNASYILARSDIPAWGLRVTGIVSDENLRASFRTGIITISALLVVSSVVLVLILSFSLRRIIRPIREVLDTMVRVSKGDLKARMAVRSGDEFEQIGVRFNTIVGEMEDMVGRLMAQIELAKGAEMKQLQAQLNPHFLYNTLDAAAWMVQMGESAKGLSILGDLGKVLRYSLERRQSGLLVPLREDLRVMRTYLNIHQLCLGDRLKIEYRIDDAALDFPIPRLLLQPVIENAVIHGIAEAGGGTITISVACREDKLEIVIEDSGKGFVVNRAALSQEPGDSHIGLALVLRRAALHFGERHTLDIHSEPGRGTRVTLRVLWPEEERCTAS